jgi:hypothetical protein
MTDKLIINKFLKNFEPKIIKNDFIIVDKVTKQELTNSEFTKLILTVFDTFFIEKDKLPFDICQEWFTKKKKKYVKELNGYLDSCVVNLGRHDWDVTDAHGNPITSDDVYKLFKNSFSIEFLNKYYNRWLSEKVLDISEELMNKW